MTVKELNDYLKNLVDNGCEEYTIKLNDIVIERDSLAVDHSKKKMEFRPHLSDSDYFKKVKRLESDIKRSIDKYMSNR